MSVRIRPLHLDAVRCPGEPGWVQLSRPPSPRGSAPSPSPSSRLLTLPTPRAPAPFAAFPEQLAAAGTGGRRAGEPAPSPAGLSGQRGPQRQRPEVGLPLARQATSPQRGAPRGAPAVAAHLPNSVRVRAPRPRSAPSAGRPASAAAGTFLPDRAALCVAPQHGVEPAPSAARPPLPPQNPRGTHCRSPAPAPGRPASGIPAASPCLQSPMTLQSPGLGTRAMRIGRVRSRGRGGAGGAGTGSPWVRSRAPAGPLWTEPLWPWSLLCRTDGRAQLAEPSPGVLPAPPHFPGAPSRPCAAALRKTNQQSRAWEGGAGGLRPSLRVPAPPWGKAGEGLLCC